MSKLYIVFQDNGAGQMWTNEVDTDTSWTYQELGGCHANNVFESHSKEECDKYIDKEIEASTKFVIFKTRDMNGEECYFWSEMNCCTGTFEEVGGSYSNPIDEFKTEEEARNYIESMHMHKSIMK